MKHIQCDTNSNDSIHVCVLASWYPSEENPVAGIFIKEQVKAISQFAQVSVIAVQQGNSARGLEYSDEDGVLTARAIIAQSFMGKIPRFDLIRKMQIEAFDYIVQNNGTPDIVHVQALWPAALGACILKKKYGIPFIVTEHSEEYLPSTELKLIKRRGMLAGVIRPLASNASAYIAVSDTLAQRLKDLKIAANSYIIPNVVSIPTLAAQAKEKKSVVKILHISQLSPAKNIPLLLQAVAELSKRRNDFSLTIVGGSNFKEYELQASALGISKQYIEFTGVVPPEQTDSYYSNSDFSVLSSTHETFSTFAAQSLAWGLPVVSTKSGGPESFINNQVGRLVENGSVDALTAGLSWMIDNHSTFSPEKLSVYARAKFSSEVVGDQIQKVYNQCTIKKGKL